MAEILLCSEMFVKNVMSISDNVAGKFIMPSIREAQEIGFQGIVGTKLYNKVRELVGSGAIESTANAMYKALLDKAQYYIAYTAIVELCPKVTFKIANAGVVKTADENVTGASADEVGKVQEYYQAKADFLAYELQQWILDNATAFPELSQNDCRHIASELYSSASSGVFLGGARGKGFGLRRCRRTRQ